MIRIVTKKALTTLLSLLLACSLFTMLPEKIKAAIGDIGPRLNTYDDPAGAYYVAPDGNDATATGAKNKPFKSINAALNVAPAGSTIVLRDGIYKENRDVRVRQPNITIKSAKGEWAIIDLSDRNLSVVQQYSAVNFYIDASGGKLQAVEVIGGFYAVSCDTTFRWDPRDPFTHGASNIIIEDCVLHDSYYDVVKVKPNCNDIIIRNNEIYNSGRAHLSDPRLLSGECNAEGIDNVNGARMLVYNNYIHDIVGTGVYAKGGASDVVIENNRIERVYGAGIMLGFDTSVDFFNTDVNPEFYENIRGTARYNLLIDIGWEGIGLYASKDAQVYNNTLVNVNYNNLFHSAIYFGLSYQDWSPIGQRPGNVNPTIFNNIVCQPNTFNRQMIEIRYSNDLGGMTALDGPLSMYDNCYYIAGKTAGFTDTRPGNLLNNGNLAAWKTHTSSDTGSIEANPNLDSNYLATNPACTGMGIPYPLSTDHSYVAVTDIRNVATTTNVKKKLVLSGKVIPSNAKSKTITWTINDPGTTEATITGNTFVAQAPGSATITATITNGAGVGSDFSQDFVILVEPKIIRAKDFFTSLTISYSTVSDAEYYQIHRSTKKTKGFKLTGTSKTLSFTDYHLNAGTTYYYKVRSVKVVKGKNVYGKWSPVITKVTPKLPNVDDLTVTSTNKGLKVQWDNDNDMTAVQIYYATTNNSKTKWKSVSVSAADFLIGHLPGNTKYYYKARYVYGDGSVFYGPFTTVATLVTGNGAVSAVVDDYTVINLTFPAESEAQSYQIQRSTNKTKGFALVGTTNATTFNDYYLVAGKTYYYRVRSVKTVAGKTVYGKWSPIYTKTSCNLPLVDDVSVTANASSLNFKWTNDHEMSALQIYYATTNNKKTKWSVKTVTPEDFDLRKLLANKGYYYKLRYVYYNGTTSYGPFTPVAYLLTN